MSIPNAKKASAMKPINVSDGTERSDRVGSNGYADSIVESGEVGASLNPSDQRNPSTAATTHRSQYSYPVLRYSVIFTTFVCVEAIVAVVLWLTGGGSKVLINSVTKFQFVQSVFDLAVITFCKFPVYLLLIHHAEIIAIQKLALANNRVLQSRARIDIVTIIVLSLCICVYAITKGSLVLYHMINDSAFEKLPRTYYACLIWCCVTSILVLLLSAALPLGLKRLQKIRILKHYNAEGQEVDEEGKVKSKGANLMRLISLAKPEAGILAGGIVAMLVSTGVQTIAPLYFGKVVDAALKSMDNLNRTVVTLLGIYIVGAAAGLARSWLFTLAGQRLVARLRTQLFSSVVFQEIAFFDTNRTGELCNRLSSDTAVLQNACTVNVSMLFRYLLQIVGSLSLMFYLNASLTGVLLAVVPVVSLGAVQYGKYVRKVRKMFQDRLADAGTQAEESLSSIRTVKSFTGEEKAIRVYGDSIQESYKMGKRLAAAQGTMEGILSLFSYGAIAAVLWYGGKLVFDNSKDPSTGITSGLLTAFLLYTLQVAMAFALLSSLYGDFMQAVGASVRIFTLLDRKPDVFVPTNPLTLSSLTGELEFKDVRFTYPSRPESEVLKGVSFGVQRGQMVALVGPSGGGKSTIVSLIERFYDPNDGCIMMDGCDLKLLDVKWFRHQIATVSQEPTLFACSIRDNIAYGREATDEEVEEAARQANAHDFISAFEDGYKTLVGERGVRLSGGQKQRVAIARALIMDPALLLLDEATSALDAESEHLVQEAIDRAMHGRTVIVIAHRLSTVRNADKVVVIDKGQIAEMGTHSELLAKHGVYKRLVLRQLTAGNPVAPSQSEAQPEPGNKSHSLANEELSTDRLVNIEESDDDGDYDYDDRDDVKLLN